ncbi:tetratricopeptide repeat protein [Microbacterium sp. LMC-P-041]|uniref:tetratricopeptide repeat protein n=1 Tax=Microbacterium sp. LMC-P-041 TaxID=3040293 RepID=UPI0025573BA8|nr:tetratricopeptide repeat protein [Microbacterium sp. LMC-P-041]
MTYPVVTPSDGRAASEPYYDLGDHKRAVSTTSADAQTWFDRGMVWAYSFNFDEAERCFARSAQADPSLAIAHWGIAYAIGPDYNKSWELFDDVDYTKTCRRARAELAIARELSARATPDERALIEALAARYPETDGPADFSALNLAYAEAMQEVRQQYPDDLDVVALCTEAMLCVSPYELWHPVTGEPDGYASLEVQRLLEDAMDSEQGRRHPGLNHLYLHLLEMSFFPERALNAGDRLRTLVPDAGHMLHMASHIDIACGDYRRGVDTNTDASRADDLYFAREKDVRFYFMYRAHNLYVKVFGAMLLGRSREAEFAARRLIEVLTEDVLRTPSPPMADWTESHVSALSHVLVRFGRWDEIIEMELPEDQDLFCVTTAMLWYAKGVAYAALSRIEEAEEARIAFREAAARVPESRLALPNREVDVLRVASAMLDGEVEYRKGNIEEAFAHLRVAIEREDDLLYSEPRSWLQPVRHAYGALLLDQGRVAEAEAVYRSDLGLDGKLPRTRVHPNNVWSLHGLHECLTRLGRHNEAAMVAMQRDIAVAAADVTITASCFCRLSAPESDGGPAETVGSSAGCTCCVPAGDGAGTESVAGHGCADC